MIAELDGRLEAIPVGPDGPSSVGLGYEDLFALNRMAAALMDPLLDIAEWGIRVRQALDRDLVDTATTEGRPAWRYPTQAEIQGDAAADKLHLFRHPEDDAHE